jgi:hypothetical protein
VQDEDETMSDRPRPDSPDPTRPVDPLDVAIHRTLEEEERLLETPPDPPRLKHAAERVVHRADDLAALATEPPKEDETLEK